ncbi:MAG: GNAT family N-acetyltransferase, partial [Rhodoferax sp.]
MVETKTLIRASLEASRDLLRGPNERSNIDAADKPMPLVVPIRALDADHRERIAAHLLALDNGDRYLRFGYAASGEQIHRYVDGLNFERDEICGVYNRKIELVAMAHLAMAGEGGPEGCKSCAEFG